MLLSLLVAVPLVGGFAPPAAAAGLLVVGMPIVIGEAGCSLGFFAVNSRGDRLAVTAGHCSTEPNQIVFYDGVPIGDVVARRDDVENAAGKLIGARGYTVIRLSRRFSLEPYFTGIGDPDDAHRKCSVLLGESAHLVTGVYCSGLRVGGWFARRSLSAAA